MSRVISLSLDFNEPDHPGAALASMFEGSSGGYEVTIRLTTAPRARGRIVGLKSPRQAHIFVNRGALPRKE